MATRQLVATIAASTILCTGIGFGISQASQPDKARAAKDPNTEVVKELKKVNSSLATTNGSLADISDKLQRNGSIYSQPLAESLEKICGYPC